MKIAHIINPVVVDSSSDLFLAQPITFATLQTARDFARKEVDVELFTAQYPEDRGFAPAGFIATPDLTRSVLDFGNFSVPRRLPLIRDILDRLYEATESSKTDYLIYTNADIAVQPYFYLAVATLIEQGYEAFTINRRTIPKSFCGLEQIPLMAAQVGQSHKGHDCLIFPRTAYPHYFLTNLCVGAFRVGMAVLVNMLYHAQRFELFTDLHLTYHLGNDRVHRSPRLADYKAYNEIEFLKILTHYDVIEHPHEHYIIQRLYQTYSPRQQRYRFFGKMDWYKQKFQRMINAWKQD